MSGWITDDWRLKVLALVLAVLMLGAVAFAQNPATTRTLAIPLTVQYTNNNIVVINPPDKVNVTFFGGSDAITNATIQNFKASVDTTHATPGPAVKLSISVTSTLPVNIQQPAPIIVHIDTIKAVDLPVQVIAHGASGWAVTASTANPATVHFTGPSSWTDHLTAAVVIPAAISSSQAAFLNQPISLQNSSGALSLIPCATVPCAAIDSSSASVTITAQTGSTSSTVPLIDAPPAQGPPAGYRITAVSITPATINITGDPAVLAKIQRITLPAMDLSSSKSTATFNVNIPLPDGVSLIGPTSQAKIVYTIEKNPNVTPSP